MPEDSHKPQDQPDEPTEPKTSAEHDTHTEENPFDDHATVHEDRVDSSKQSNTHSPFEPQPVPAPHSFAQHQPQQPQFQPQPTAPVAELAKNNPGVLVLQWLTYAFWGWTVFALSWLTTLSFTFFIGDSGDSELVGTFTAYALASVIVLFIISLVCDILYSKKEPEHKQGGAMVIMIIHAVIYALFAIGWLVSSVFAVVSMLIGDGNDGATSILLSGLVVAFIYGLTLVRVLRPSWPKRINVLYPIAMAVIAVIVTVLGVVGPAMSLAASKDDRLIERGLPDVSSAVRDYAADNDALPQNLDAIRDDLSSDSRDLVDRDLVEYTPGKKVESQVSDDRMQTMIYPAPGQDAYEYRLCVVYKSDKNDDIYDSPSSRERDTSPNTYAHGSGRVCYDLVTEYVY